MKRFSNRYRATLVPEMAASGEAREGSPRLDAANIAVGHRRWAEREP